MSSKILPIIRHEPGVAAKEEIINIAEIM